MARTTRDQIKSPLVSFTEHFLNIPSSTTITSGVLGFLVEGFGTGNSNGDITIADRAGVTSVSTGTAGSGRRSIVSNGGVVLSTGVKTYSLEFEFQIPIVPDATESFGIGLGFTNANAFTNAVTGAYLRCTNTDFIAVNKLTPSGLTEVTLTPIDTAWHIYKVSFNSAGVVHTLDGVSTTIATNIPINVAMQRAATIGKSAGFTARTINIDRITFEVN